MATLTLAQWAIELQPADLPSSVRQAGIRSLYNYIGCAIGGSNHPTVIKAHTALQPFFGAASATIFGHKGSLKADPQHAALLNGIASHVHDYDDTHLATIIHPTGPVASAALAYAEYVGDVSGEDMLCALVAGIEASCKLGLSVWPSHYDLGWHITSTTGSIGAAVAVGKLMRLSVEQMAHAIGIAATQVTGLREMFGSDTKAFHLGRAAQNGLLAAKLARGGFTSSLQALEAKRGWGNVVLGSETFNPDFEKWVSRESPRGIGRTWDVESNAFKPFPCGIVCHPAIDGAIRLHADINEDKLANQDILQVQLRVHPLVIELTSKRKPKDGLEGKFSVFHGVAVGLLYGQAGPAQYADEVVTAPEVVSTREKVEAEPDQSLKPDEAYLLVEFKDGTKLEKHVDHAVGSLEQPMTNEQLVGKFVDQCALVLGEEAAKNASRTAWGLAEATDVAEVIRRL